MLQRAVLLTSSSMVAKVQRTPARPFALARAHTHTGTVKVQGSRPQIKTSWTALELFTGEPWQEDLETAVDSPVKAGKGTEAAAVKDGCLIGGAHGLVRLIRCCELCATQCKA